MKFQAHGQVRRLIRLSIGRSSYWSTLASAMALAAAAAKARESSSA
jgi:hypothetical protein